jgi:hypothetical protein
MQPRPNSAHGMMVVPIKMNKNIEKICACTLSSVKGSASGAVPNKEEIIILDKSFSLTHLAVNLQDCQI